MKMILLAVLFASCATRYCQPTKGSRDYAYQVLSVKKYGPFYKVRMCHTWGGEQVTKTFYYECLPDTVRQGSYVSSRQLQTLVK
jgi:hypothetical protein